MLANNVNDNAGILVNRAVITFFASKLAPTKKTHQAASPNAPRGSERARENSTGSAIPQNASSIRFGQIQKRPDKSRRFHLPLVLSAGMQVG